MNPPDIFEVSGVQSYRRSCLRRLSCRLTTFPSFAEGKSHFVKACLLTLLIILMCEAVTAERLLCYGFLETADI